MKKKANRLDAIKMIISSKEVGSQEELLQELNREGFELTQATLSRDLKQLKVAKAASMNGKYVYVLPNNIMYKRSTDQSAGEMLRSNGFISLQFSCPGCWRAMWTMSSAPPWCASSMTAPPSAPSAPGSPAPGGTFFRPSSTGTPCSGPV